MSPGEPMVMMSSSLPSPTVSKVNGSRSGISATSASSSARVMWAADFGSSGARSSAAAVAFFGADFAVVVLAAAGFALVEARRVARFAPVAPGRDAVAIGGGSFSRYFSDLVLAGAFDFGAAFFSANPSVFNRLYAIGVCAVRLTPSFSRTTGKSGDLSAMIRSFRGFGGDSMKTGRVGPRPSRPVVFGWLFHGQGGRYLPSDFIVDCLRRSRLSMIVSAGLELFGRSSRKVLIRRACPEGWAGTLSVDTGGNNGGLAVDVVPGGGRGDLRRVGQVVVRVSVLGRREAGRLPLDLVPLGCVGRVAGDHMGLIDALLEVVEGGVDQGRAASLVGLPVFTELFVHLSLTLLPRGRDHSLGRCSPQGRSVSLTISFGKGREAHLAEKSLPAWSAEEGTLRVPGLIVEGRGERHTPGGGGVAGGVRLLRVAGQGGTRQVAGDVELEALMLVDRQGQYTEVLEAGTRRLGDDELAGGRVRDQGGHIVAGVEADVDD